MRDELRRTPWQVDEGDFPRAGTVEEQATFLLRYAVLAPSSHNAQPWAFAVDGSRVAVHRDDSRWLPVADTDRRELHLSLGCALENLLVAAEHFGFSHEVAYRPDAPGSPAAAATLRPGDPPADGRPADLFDAITDRHTNRRVFDDRDLPAAVRDRLRGCVRNYLREGVQDHLPADVGDRVALHLVDDGQTLAALAALQRRADERLFADPRYRRELGYWIGTGALGANWPRSRVGQLAVTLLDLGGREGRKNARLLESAPVVAVFAGPADDWTAQLAVGQAFERMALAATAEGVASHPLSQILEVPALRGELAALLDLEAGVPQHLVRLGYADPEPEHTPRRPLDAVLR